MTYPIPYTALEDALKELMKPVLDFFDFISNSVMMPIVALATCVFVGYFLKPQAVIEEVTASGEFRENTLFSVMIRYVAPVCLLVILVFSALSPFIPAFSL